MCYWGNFYIPAGKVHKCNKLVMQMTNSLIFDYGHLKRSAWKPDCCWMHVSVPGIKGWTWRKAMTITYAASKTSLQSVTFLSRGLSGKQYKVHNLFSTMLPILAFSWQKVEEPNEFCSLSSSTLPSLTWKFQKSKHNLSMPTMNCSLVIVGHSVILKGTFHTK